MSGNKAAMMKRREKDIFKLRSSKYPLDQTENQSTYQIEFHGPEGTPYELGKWKINLYLPEDYPYKSPSVGFLNKIYHPNIDYRFIIGYFSSGSVCLDVINQTWTPMYELLNIFEIFLPQLLTYPNPASPLNQEAAQLFEESIEKYNKKVVECINKYALNKELAEKRVKKEEMAKKEEKQEKQEKEDKEDKEEKGKKEEVNMEDMMDEEGSSLSEHDSIMDNDDLKLY